MLKMAYFYKLHDHNTNSKAFKKKKPHRLYHPNLI
jgi:hypothetical protein